MDGGDVLLLKRSSGPIVGICSVGEAMYRELGRDTWRRVPHVTGAEVLEVRSDEAQRLAVPVVELGQHHSVSQVVAPAIQFATGTSTVHSRSA